MSLEYKFDAKVWKYQGGSPWYFITLPQEYAAEIKHVTSDVINSFGSVRVSARVENLSWQTSLFPDSVSGSYLLPIKKSIRIVSEVKEGKMITVIINILEQV